MSDDGRSFRSTSDGDSTTSEADAFRERTRDALVRRLGIDARALATFRIALGLILLFDVWHRSRDLVAFYTDDGVLPTAVLAEQSATATYSIHALSGEPRVQALLFSCAAVFAVALCLGYRTRTVTVLSLALLVSVHFRNPFVLNGADRLLRELVALAVFLPLGSRWAIDAQREPAGGDCGRRSTASAGSDTLIATPATAAILCHIVAVFVSNALVKAEGNTWHSGEALHYALRQDHVTILLGNHLANYPSILTAGTYGWVGLVTGAPLLIVLTGRRRAAYAGAFIAAVTGMAVSMAVGLFPAVLAAAFLLFLPPRVWDALERAGDAAIGRVRPLEYGAATVRDAIGRPNRPRTVGSKLPEPTRRCKQQCWSILVCGVLIVVALWSVGLLGAAGAFEPVDAIDPEDNEWRMFAPDPSTSYGWYTVEAGVDGEENIDVLRGSTLRRGRPSDASETLPNFRWRKYLNSLFDSDERAERFAAFVCDSAAAQTDGSVENVTVTYTEQPIDLDGDRPDPTTVTLVERPCSSADGARGPES